MFSSFSSSSSKAGQVNPFVEPDATFKSFNSLLQAKVIPSPSPSNSLSATSSNLTPTFSTSANTFSSHLSLLSDETLYGSISHFLSHLDSKYTNQFLHSVITSPGLWQLPLSNLRHSDANSRLDLLKRCKEITNCVAYSVTKRVDLLISSRNGSTSWKSRRLLTVWLNQFLTAFNVSNSETSSITNPSLAIPRLSILTGVLQGLQSVKATRRKNNGLGLNVNYHIRFIEDEWLIVFAESLEAIHSIYQGTDAKGEGDDWEKEFKRVVLKNQDGKDVQDSATNQSQEREERARSNALAPIYLSSLVLPFITASKQEALPSNVLIQIYSDSLISMLSDSSLLSKLSQDFQLDSNDKVICVENSETSYQADRLLQHELFSILGPMSRILADGIGRAVRNSRPEEISSLLLGDGPNGDSSFKSNSFLKRMSTLSSEWESRWKSSKLNRINESQLSESNQTKKITTSLWKIFKSFLFSQTMIFDSLTEAIVDMSPSPTITLPISKSPHPLTSSEIQIQSRWNVKNTSNLSNDYLHLITEILKIYSQMFWITSSFGISPLGGPAGFDTYRKVFYSSLDVLSRDELKCTKLVQDLAFSYLKEGEKSTELHEMLELDSNLGMDDDSITYFFDLVEQLVVVLSDEIIEDLILPICRRYLTDNSNAQPFESAHSVVLAIYNHDKGCVTEFSPFYVQLLLESFPGRMTAEQQEHAFTTVTGAVSERSDAITWWILKRLEEEISKARFESLGITSSSSSSNPSKSLSDASSIETEYQNQEEEAEKEKEAAAAAAAAEEEEARQEKEEKKDKEFNSSLQQSSFSPLSSIPSANSAKESPSSSTQRLSLSKHTSLQLLYIGQLPNVNLVLLPSVLRKVKEFISSEKKGSNDRIRLLEKCWSALAGLDASTREEGTRWWLDNREAFGV